MKKINAIFAAMAITGASLTGTTALASDDNHFAGGYVVLTQEWKRASATVDGAEIKKSEAAPALGLGYTFALDRHMTLGIKASIDTKNGEYGVSPTTEVKEQSHYAIAIEPGYAIDDHLLVFGIVALHRAKAELIVEEASAGKASLNGMGYGFGAKYALPNHWFLMGEIQNVNYSSKTIGESRVKPSSHVVAFGLGYHF
jgi:opacity protein-like surface antigen